MILFPWPNLKDVYKVGHPPQYPDDTEMVYSNFTARGTRRFPAPAHTLHFGPQYFMLEYLIRQPQETFFDQPRDAVLKAYQRRVDGILGPGTDIRHMGELHELGYLPLQVKTLDEGTLVPYRIPTLTIRNTDKKFAWLTNSVESLMSNALWKASTSATTAFYMRRTFDYWAMKTGVAKDSIQPWQGHDFSFRGMSGIEDAALSGAGHLLSFYGTDNIPAIDFLEHYYGADCERELIGGSVMATEHSVMCMGGRQSEYETFYRLLTKVKPTGIISIVSDTWDFWKVVTETLVKLRPIIMSRDGKLVIRPDSGDPVMILCGDPLAATRHERMGLIRVLYEIFGGIVNSAGFVELDPHIGAIYGDSITPERQQEILKRLWAMGFASSNIVLGVGSFTYEYVTRDTDGSAIKATYGEVAGRSFNISKDPKTDNGVKKSAEGLLQVYRDGNGQLALKERCTWDEENKGLLKTIFLNGKAISLTNLQSIRTLVWSQL